jgi:DNA polymerase-3 subunit delta
MAKNGNKGESIYNLNNYLPPNQVLPVYFFFGEDSYTISNAVDALSHSVSDLIESDFDRVFIDASKETTVAQVIDTASAFPFGSGKKLLIIKNFENVGEKKYLADYVNNPADFTIMVITQSGKKVDYRREPFNSLTQNGFLFEAHEQKGADLQFWVMKKGKEIGISISKEDSQMLVDIIGENKALLEMNLQKLFDYFGEKNELNSGDIEKLTAFTKEYTIFNLQDAIGSGNKAEALKIIFNLISNGQELVYIISMLSKFVSAIAHDFDLSRQKISDFEAAKQAEVSFFYYKKCKEAKFLKSQKKLRNAAKALLNADIAVKTSSADSKSIATMLVSEIMN